MVFDRRTPEQRAAATAHQAAVVKAAADEREAARVAATPLGQAVAAKQRGDRFFQMQIPISSLEGQSSFGEPTSSFRNHGPRGGLLGEIEDLGWHLEHTGFVFIETASVSTNRFIATGQGTAQRGLLVGVYLFREVAPAGDRRAGGEARAEPPTRPSDEPVVGAPPPVRTEVSLANPVPPAEITPPF